MRIESRIADLHAAIDAEWQRKQKEEMKELALKDTCPECDGTNLSDAGRCWDCTASEYQEEERW